MSEQTTPPRDSSLVIVFGAMNPLVHTPQFYRMIGAMDEGELQAALKMPLNSTSASGSQFDFGSPSISINCQPGQWWIHAPDLESWDRILKIAGLVFGKLGGTPIGGYALIAQRHIATAVSNVKSALGARIAATGLGFARGETSASNIELVLNEEDYAVTTAVQPSVLGEQSVYVFYQRQYPVPVSATGIFTLEPVVRSRLASFEEASKSFFDAVSAGIESTEVKS